jgi:hypothetical protein
MVVVTLSNAFLPGSGEDGGGDTAGVVREWLGRVYYGLMMVMVVMMMIGCWTRLRLAGVLLEWVGVPA